MRELPLAYTIHSGRICANASSGKYQYALDRPVTHHQVSGSAALSPQHFDTSSFRKPGRASG
eukprot:4393340-Prymnesium_polylepis.1